MKQMLKFAAVGIGSGAVNFLVYNIFLFIFQYFHIFTGFDYLIALIAGFILSVLWSFLLSRKYVFTAPEARAVAWYTALLKMYIVYSITGIGLNSALSLLWVEVLGIPKQIVTIINDIAGFPITYLLNKYWSFRKTAS